ncbi:MAG: pimeloyl-ACP methyl ester carboxylesterase [Candidatus Azotimanducaceae bacterium]|jgi:pimeloyl-ACP methyl ester carboxylesterase
MKVIVKGHSTHVATGGKEFNPALPCVLFLHGSGMDHRAWALQTRWFAYNGYSVLAPDFPGHSLSSGEALNSIEASAEWLMAFLDVTGVSAAHIIGHSQGFLSALAFAKLKPAALKSLIGVGTAAAIPVNPALIETAQKSAYKAADMMLQWGFGNGIHMGMSPIPGMQPIAVGRQIMGKNPLATDLQCCAAYVNGESVAGELDVPALVIIAGQDKMAPPKFGKKLAEQLSAETIVLDEFGHMLPIEAPKQVLHALRDFIVKQESH